MTRHYEQWELEKVLQEVSERIDGPKAPLKILAAEVQALRGEAAELRVRALRLASAVRSHPPDIEPAVDALLDTLGISTSLSRKH